MVHQADSRDGTQNKIDNSDIGGSVIQAGSIFYIVRNGFRRVEVVVGAVFLTALVAAGGILLPTWLDDGKSSAGDGKSAPGRPRADSDTTVWGCRESAVVPGMEITPRGMAPLESFPRGGVKASGSSISIVLQGSSDEELLLTGARAQIVSRHRPVRGLHVGNPCGSDAPRRVFTLDLDQSAAALKAVPDAEAGAAPFRGWPYAVKRGDAEYFLVKPQSTRYETEFRILLSWRSGGRGGTLVIDDRGKPFRVTASTAAEQTCVTVRDQTMYWLMPADSSSCPDED
ncbi:hypothetical protein GCM10010515_71920 [Streptomyces fructofermentans]|uniref:Uncharacterized protein n=2 Tax=Streptomyces fructofermentans TaxID=152141 RepID=A0A918NUA5_9ACTN|nr:hypothetical protein GCM10010515_71920 [Streptomyces fructofermentans]